MGIGYVQAERIKDADLPGSYDLVLIILQHGIVSIESYDLHNQLSMILNRNLGRHIYSLNLADSKESYGILVCDSSTHGSIIVRSHNELLCDYCLNWGAMLGIDVDLMNDSVQLPVQLDNNNIVISKSITNKTFHFVIQSDAPVQHVCAMFIPTQTVRAMHTINYTMSLADACRLGIVLPKNHTASFLCQTSVDQELEFDRILDDMTKDGTIAIKPVSPFTIWLQSIGSVFLVKYISLRARLGAWWNYFRHGHKSQQLL